MVALMGDSEFARKMVQRYHPNLYEYMIEASVRESDYVLLICTPAFAARADDRVGGVGYEQAVVTGEIFSSTAHPEKFIPVLRGDPATSELGSKGGSGVGKAVRRLTGVDVRSCRPVAEVESGVLRRHDRADERWLTSCTNFLLFCLVKALDPSHGRERPLGYAACAQGVRITRGSALSNEDADRRLRCGKTTRRLRIKLHGF